MLISFSKAVCPFSVCVRLLLLPHTLSACLPSVFLETQMQTAWSAVGSIRCGTPWPVLSSCPSSLLSVLGIWCQKHCIKPPLSFKASVVVLNYPVLCIQYGKYTRLVRHIKRSCLERRKMIWVRNSALRNEGRESEKQVVKGKQEWISFLVHNDSNGQFHCSYVSVCLYMCVYVLYLFHLSFILYRK